MKCADDILRLIQTIIMDRLEGIDITDHDVEELQSCYRRIINVRDRLQEIADSH
jgi:hypothetical protein